MKIVILGATGQIGKVVFEYLKSKNNYHIIGTTRKKSKGLLQFDPFKDNWNVLDKVDVLINCIGQINETTKLSFDDIHLGVTKKIIENRYILNNPKIIQISALGASSTHPVKFLSSKGRADEYLLNHKNTFVVRPSIVCTHNTMLVKKIIMLRNLSKFTLGTLFLPKGFKDHMVQPIMPIDLASIIEILCIADSAPFNLNVCGPDRISFNSLIETVLKVRNIKYRIIEIRKSVIDLLLKFIVAPLFPSIINSQQYQLLFEDNISDKSEVEKLLGRPLMSTKEYWNEEFK